jgi:hypothetical protein
MVEQNVDRILRAVHEAAGIAAAWHRLLRFLDVPVGIA